MTLEEKLELMRQGLSEKLYSRELEKTSRDSDICPKCRGNGFILFKGEDGRQYAKECNCLKERIEQHRLRFAHLPEAFRDMQLKTFSTAVYSKPESKTKINAACKIIKTYLDNFWTMESAGLGLYIYSNTKGTGKTRMAASIANELMQRGKQVKFAVSTTILKEIKNTWKGESEYSESRLLDQLSLTDILIIDDFGTEKVADWINDKFYHIINERYNWKRITIFTGNNSLDELEYDDRIVDRIKERTYQIEFPDESVRELLSRENNQRILMESRSGKE